MELPPTNRIHNCPRCRGFGRIRPPVTGWYIVHKNGAVDWQFPVTCPGCEGRGRVTAAEAVTIMLEQ